MSSSIRILLDQGELTATLDDSLTARAILDALPLEATASTWGQEIYFSVPVQVPEAADAREEMAAGELAYWPMGAAFCIFFGPTPVSQGAEPRAYSPVNALGRIDGDATRFRAVKQGESVLLTRIEME